VNSWIKGQNSTGGLCRGGGLGLFPPGGSRYAPSPRAILCLPPQGGRQTLAVMRHRLWHGQNSRLLALWYPLAVLRKLRIQYPGAVYHPPAPKLRWDWRDESGRRTAGVERGRPVGAARLYPPANACWEYDNLINGPPFGTISVFACPPCSMRLDLRQAQGIGNQIRVSGPIRF